MRIIQANKFYYLKGGAERYMLELSDWLVEQGNEVLPFAMDHERNLDTPYKNTFVSNVQTEKAKFGLSGLKTVGRMFYSLEARRQMSTFVVQQKPDICHIHNIYTQISPSILHTLKENKVPVVMTVHDHHLISPQYNIWAHGCGDDYRNASILKASIAKFHKNSLAASFAQVTAYKFHRWLKIYENNVDIFIVPSNYMKRQLVAGGFPQEKIRVNHYGIDAKRIHSSSENKGYMLFVGRLSEEKGVETIIRTAKLLPDIEFKIVGRGPDSEYLHHLAHGIKNISFLGFRVGDELVKLYQESAAVLLPSRVHENFPLITLEAMAIGKPVVASHVGGVPEVVKDRLTGFLVNPIDIHAWTEAIMRLAYDDDLREQMSRNSRELVEKEFSLDEHYRRLMMLYDEAISNK